MTRSEYLEKLREALSFESETSREEIVADISDYFDAHHRRGLSDEEIVQKLGSVHSLAAEYRAQNDTARAIQTPGASLNVRAAKSMVAAGLLRATALPLLYLLYGALAFLIAACAILAVVSLLVAIAAALEWRPLVTVLAVPEIPAITGVGMGIAAAELSLLLYLLLSMQTGYLSRFIATVLHRRAGSAAHETASSSAVHPAGALANGSQQRRRMHIVLAFLTITVLATAVSAVFVEPEVYLYPMPPAINITWNEGDDVSVVSDSSDLTVTFSGNRIRAETEGSLKATFGQEVKLEHRMLAGMVQIALHYSEGLDWGINEPPVLQVTLPAAFAASRSTLHLETQDGNISLTLPSGTGAQLDFRSVSGSAHSNLPSNANGLHIEARTTSGNLVARELP